MTVESGRAERAIARVLTVGTLAGVALLVAGVVAMIAWKIDPLDRPWPVLDPGRLASDLRELKPAGPLWLGLAVVILTPAARVLSSVLIYTAEGDRRMAAVAAAILIVIALSAILGAGG